MRTPVYLIVAFVAWTFLSTGAEAAVRAAGDELFSDPAIRHFAIMISEPELQKLRRENRSYVSATVTVDDKVFKDVAVRLKGRGSFRPLEDKPSFAVKFDEFVPHQKLFGVSKIMLNNSSQDSTFLSEYLATSLFRDAGLPAARVSHARVTFNGRPLGFYVLIEAMNKAFLKRHFANASGNLYEGYAKDIDQTLEHDAGPPSDQSDLRALLAAARLPESERALALPQILNVDRFFSFLAVTMLIAQHDSYPLNRNNYRIYHDPDSNQFTMIPHGIDGTFRENNISIRPPPKFILTRAVLGLPDGPKLYRERLGTLFTNVLKLDIISNRIEAASTRLQAAAANEQERTKISRHTASMLRHIQLRHDRVARQLAQPDPSHIRIEGQQSVTLTGWEPDVDEGTALLERQIFEGRSALYIKAGSAPSLGVWRIRALLEPGRYRLTGMLRTSNSARTNSRSSMDGVALRIYKMYSTPKRMLANGDWTETAHHFTVAPGEEEVEFICEFRGSNAEAWFDSESIKLTKEL